MKPNPVRWHTACSESILQDPPDVEESGGSTFTYLTVPGATGFDTGVLRGEAGRGRLTSL